MKPKEWLLKQGHITEITRGRMSRKLIDLIEEAVRQGVQIEGYAVAKDSPKAVESSTPAPAAVNKVPVANVNKVADVPDERRPEDVWEAYANLGKGGLTVIGMREVCNTCKNSLTYCPCKTPLVYLDFQTEAVVNFRPRKNPLPVKRW